jgi:CheY-like chemotaxis protein
VLVPGPDGYEVCRRIKADPALRETAVVVVTSRVDDDARQRVREAGVDAYVPSRLAGRAHQAGGRVSPPPLEASR